MQERQRLKDRIKHLRKYFTDNSISNTKTQTEMLLSEIGPTACHQLQRILSPRDPRAHDFNELCQVLDKVYCGQVKTVESIHFEQVKRQMDVHLAEVDALVKKHKDQITSSKNEKDDELMKQHVARFPELKNEHSNRVTNSITAPKYFEPK